MAPVADQVNAATVSANLARRGNDGIAFTDFKILPGSPILVRFKWSYHRRSPDDFSVWLRNVKTRVDYLALGDVGTRNNGGQLTIGVGVVGTDTGKFQILLTKLFSTKEKDIYARSGTFDI
ncbi:hypothetical protein FRC01_000823 [Tulasnella sp. 417]|nr:hypothetical protein FRC01_000823 [Tulasnella sp. 417]